MKNRKFLLPWTLTAILASGTTAAAQGGFTPTLLPAPCNGGPGSLQVVDLFANWAGNVFIAPPRYLAGINFVAFADGDTAGANYVCADNLPSGSVSIFQFHGGTFSRLGGPGSVTLNSTLCVAATAQAAADPNGSASASGLGSVLLTSSLVPGGAQIAAAASASVVTPPITSGAFNSNSNILVVNASALSVNTFNIAHFAFASASAACDSGSASGGGGGKLNTAVTLN